MKESLRKIGEFGLISRISGLFPQPGGPGSGIGDDAVILPCDEREDLVWTTDTIVDGVDFLLKRHAPEAIGRKALAVNLSDLAAMAARPWRALLTFGIPKNFGSHVLDRCLRGIRGLAAEWKIPVVGGDITQAPAFLISMAVLGRVPTREAILRSGARTGDWIFVTGSLGGSILGKHLHFTPRIREADYLRRRFRPHAMIDVSDGLVSDLEHLTRASGKGAGIYLNRIPVSKDAFKFARGKKISPMENAFTGGEDFELLFTVSPETGARLEKTGSVCHTAVSKIGEITASRGIRFHLDEQDRRGRALKWKGYTHF